MRLNVHPFTFKLLRFRPRIVCFVGKKIWDVYEAVAKKTAKVSPNGGEGNGTDRSVTVEFGEIGRIAAITTIAGNNGFLGENGYEEEVPLKVEDEMVEPVAKVESELSIRGDASGGSPQRNSQEVMQVEVKPDLPASPTTPLRHGHLAASTASTPQRQSNASTMDWYKPRSIRLPLPPLENGSPGSYCYFWVTPSTSGLERTPVCHGNSRHIDLAADQLDGRTSQHILRFEAVLGTAETAERSARGRVQRCEYRWTQYHERKDPGGSGRKRQDSLPKCACLRNGNENHMHECWIPQIESSGRTNMVWRPGEEVTKSKSEAGHSQSDVFTFTGRLAFLTLYLLTDTLNVCHEGCRHGPLVIRKSVRLDCIRPQEGSKDDRHAGDLVHHLQTDLCLRQSTSKGMRHLQDGLNEIHRTCNCVPPLIWPYRRSDLLRSVRRVSNRESAN